MRSQQSFVGGMGFMLSRQDLLRGALIACLSVSNSPAVEPTAVEIQSARQWVEATLGDDVASSLPFSFLYGGKPSGELLRAWKREIATRSLDERRSERVITLTDPATRLVLRCTAVVYRDCPAVEWVLHVTNAGRADTPIFEDVQALNAEFGPSEAGGPCTLYCAEGSHERITDFRPLEKTLSPGQRIRLASFGGRSSDGTLPLLNLAGPGGGGTAIGVGWTGQWAASFARSGKGPVRVRAGMELTRLKLHPGETMRTPAILLLFWSGPDRMRGQNLLRRLLLHHYTPTPGGKPVQPPFALSPHAVVRFEDTTQENMLQAIRNVASRGIAADYWWIDTGWFPCARNWARYVGNPDPDPTRFPRGLRPVADAAHAAGMKFLLWFEPERVMPDTWLHKHHPQWLLRPGDAMPAEIKYQIRDGFHLLDLGHPEALAWLKAKLSGMIGDVGIDCYRNDFNMYPLDYWRNGEPPDRQGIREIRYIVGLYDLFDTLQRRHPHLLLDTCASGGRRIDFEMLRRALVLTRSDYLWDPIGQQCHTYGLAQWIPITGIGAASLDRYNCRSGLGSHFALAADVYSNDQAVWDAMANVLKEHTSLKPFYTGDFYPLGPYSTAADAWMAWQFHREDLGEGLVQAFRRQQSPVERETYRLAGLEPTAEYSLTNRDDPTPSRMTGRQLMEQGIKIHLPTSPAAAVFVYRRVAPQATKAASRSLWPGAVCADRGR
jgi:alpha-galactosidase